MTLFDIFDSPKLVRISILVLHNRFYTEKIAQEWTFAENPQTYTVGQH